MSVLGELYNRVGKPNRVLPTAPTEETTIVRDFNSDDEGKRVVTADGDMIGTIEEASGASAHVAPDEDLSRGTRRRLGWTEEGEETYQLQKSKVNRITDTEVRLRRTL